MPFQKNALRTLANCRNGNVAALFAMFSTVLLLVVGGSIDYLRLTSARTEMQSLADAAALVSARSISVAHTEEASIKALAMNYVAEYADSKIAGAKPDVSVDLDRRRVELSLVYKPETYFNTPFTNTTLRVNAVAQVMGELPLCVLTLNESDKQTIDMYKNSRLSGVECAVYANSNSPAAIEVDAGGELSAGLVCSAGGGNGDISPSLTTDCPILPDPLAGRPAPGASGCDENNASFGVDEGSSPTSREIANLIKSDTAGEQSGTDKDRTDSVDDDSPRKNVILKPGVYCGGLVVRGSYDVELEPGVYIIKDGPLFVDGTAHVRGTNVGFYFTGDGSSLYFGSNTSIHLTAPTDGDLAGLLLFQDSNNEQGQLFGILSDDARVLTGTIYLPAGELVVDTDRAVADQSAYTAIVVRDLSLFTGPNLVLNTDYDETDVPAAVGVDYNDAIRLVN